jgi:hypothetical protein
VKLACIVIVAGSHCPPGPGLIWNTCDVNGPTAVVIGKLSSSTAAAGAIDTPARTTVQIEGGACRIILFYSLTVFVFYSSGRKPIFIFWARSTFVFGIFWNLGGLAQIVPPDRWSMVPKLAALQTSGNSIRLSKHHQLP